MPDRINIHGTGLVIGGKGVIIRGPSGAGKSLLALELMDMAATRGQESAVISDDRLDVEPSQNKLIAYAAANIGGLIELRGRGIVKRPFVQTAQIHLIVELVDELVRMVEEEALHTMLEGVPLPRCPVPQRGVIDSSHQRLLVAEALAAL